MKLFLFQLRSIRSLSQNLSLKAISEEDSQIIGVALYDLISRNDHSGPKFNKKRIILISNLFDRVPENIWDYIPREFDIAADLCVLSVSKKYSHQGIAKTLIVESKKHLQRQRVSVMVVECTSNFSARLCESENMHFVCSLPFEDYKGEDGNAVFEQDPPHTNIKVFYQIL